MELALARLLVQRAMRRPFLMAAWVGLCALPWILAVIGPLGPYSRTLFSSRLVYEVAFAWGLIGGVTGLAALGDIAIGLEPLGTVRRLRAQGTTLLMCILLPALPIVLMGFVPADHEAVPIALERILVLGIHLTAIGVLVAQLPTQQLRSIAFLALAWLVPALASPSLRGIVVPVFDATAHLDVTSGSSAWQATFAPILALVLTAIGVDVLRRPAT